MQPCADTLAAPSLTSRPLLPEILAVTFLVDLDTEFVLMLRVKVHLSLFLPRPINIYEVLTITEVVISLRSEFQMSTSYFLVH